MVPVNGSSQEATTRIRKQVTVVASDRNAVTAAKIRYREYTSSEDLETDVVGPTYSLSFDGRKLSVERADGRPMRPDELRLVEQDNNAFGKPGELAGMSFDKGRRTVFPADRLGSWAEAFPEPAEAALTLTETRGPNAHFKLELQAGDPEADHMSLLGEMVAERATGAWISLAASGTFSMKGVAAMFRMGAESTCRQGYPAPPDGARKAGGGAKL
jgi:hypothetical protein